MMKLNLIRFLLTGLFLIAISCSLDPTLADEESVEVKEESTLRQMMDGAYSTMTNYQYYGRNYIIVGEVMADNVFANGNSSKFETESTMRLNSRSGSVDGLFRVPYSVLANPNIIINSDLEEVPGNSDDVNHILGEAYALRAFVHFDLIRFFGQQYISEGEGLGVSYVTAFKGEDYNNTPRGTIEENKDQLYQDIEEAIGYLKSAGDSQYSDDKTRITLDAVYGLKSRIGVYFKDYDKALEGSQEIVNAYSITEANKVMDYWANQSPGGASIFELAQNTVDNADLNSLAYIFRSVSYGDIQVFSEIYTDANFGSNDVRASSEMIDLDSKDQLKNMGKYPAMDDELGSDNIKLIRIEEIVLNHAEALLETGEEGSALTYLNKIPEKRNGTIYSEATIDHILEERRKELLFEGFRFFDLQRHGKNIKDTPESNNNHGEVLAGDNRFVLPIPEEEININKKTKQNPGY